MVAGIALATMILGGCGSTNFHSTGSVAASRPGEVTTSTVTDATCPPGEVLGTPGTCDTVDPNLNLQVNNAYKKFPPATEQQAVAAAPVAAVVRAAVPAIAAHPPITEASVRTALQAAIASTDPHAETEVSSNAANGDGIGFGVFVPVGKAGACVHGWISTSDNNVAVDGISPDGGCLPLLGA
jgi:hypothetical protein